MLEKPIDTYRVDAVCGNCQWQGMVDIPRGWEVFGRNPCPHCGLGQLRAVHAVPFEGPPADGRLMSGELPLGKADVAPGMKEPHIL